MNWTLERLTSFLIRAGLDPNTGARITQPDGRAPNPAPEFDPMDFIPCQNGTLEVIDL